ncbi:MULTISPECIES: hypothetical protein [unclassified Caballeronia]|uniref:hypothetical protein n=1 Tax=unclassified Caballeronia TaxID=2646786 RepID=UPI002028DA8F|nr:MULTISPECIES: hypothetical protein [unclassified Caballeronia]
MVDLSSKVCAGFVAFAFRFCLSLFDFAGSRIRVGLLALPLCGAALTFFAAAKKVSKESSY